jgi:hypothetical protein
MELSVPDSTEICMLETSKISLALHILRAACAIALVLPISALASQPEAQSPAQQYPRTSNPVNITTVRSLPANASASADSLTTAELIEKVNDLQAEMNKLAARVAAPAPEHSNSLQSAAGLEISGFMDAVYRHDESREFGDNFYLNQVEIDLTRELNHRARATLGIIYSEGFEIGVAEIGYALKTDTEAPNSAFKNVNIAAGQFDAPFGEDVSCYASNTRKSVTVPDIVDNTHCLWNDVGVRSEFTFERSSVDMWLVRGFSLNSDFDIDDHDHVLNAAAGTRLNHTFGSVLRLGGSSAFGWLPNGTSAMQIYGVHTVLTSGKWTSTLEGILLQEQYSSYTSDRRGFYLQTIRELRQFFALARADYTELEYSDLSRSLSLGGGARLGSGLECRCEFKSTQKKRSQAFIQLVASF